MLSGGHHAECFGLAIGLVHILAFGVPIIGAWYKETVYRARFTGHSLFERAMEVVCYLLMIVGASSMEDVHVRRARAFSRTGRRSLLL